MRRRTATLLAIEHEELAPARLSHNLANLVRVHSPHDRVQQLLSHCKLELVPAGCRICGVREHKDEVEQVSI